MPSQTELLVRLDVGPPDDCGEGGAISGCGTEAACCRISLTELITIDVAGSDIVNVQE